MSKRPDLNILLKKQNAGLICLSSLHEARGFLGQQRLLRAPCSSGPLPVKPPARACPASHVHVSSLAQTSRHSRKCLVKSRKTWLGLKVWAFKFLWNTDSLRFILRLNMISVKENYQAGVLREPIK